MKSSPIALPRAWALASATKCVSRLLASTANVRQVFDRNIIGSSLPSDSP